MIMMWNLIQILGGREKVIQIKQEDSKDTLEMVNFLTFLIWILLIKGELMGFTLRWVQNFQEEQ
jgi:hypothetical protein